MLCIGKRGVTGHFSDNFTSSLNLRHSCTSPVLCWSPLGSISIAIALEKKVLGCHKFCLSMASIGWLSTGLNHTFLAKTCKSALKQYFHRKRMSQCTVKTWKHSYQNCLRYGRKSADVRVSGCEAGLAVFICTHRVVLGSFVFRLSLVFLLFLLCSCAHRWVPVSFPFICACWGIARWVLLLLLLFSSYSFRFFCQFGFPCVDVASWSCCRLEFYKSRLSVCAVCRWLELGDYVQCDTETVTSYWSPLIIFLAILTSAVPRSTCRLGK